MSAKKKVRVEFKRNRSKPPRSNDFTKHHGEDAGADAISGERVRAKGDLSRSRTIRLDASEDSGTNAPADDDAAIRSGRVLRVHGLHSFVQLDDGTVLRCTVRRLLKTLQTDERSLVTTGDRVGVRPSDVAGEGVIDRVAPRHGVLTRASRRREHVVVANVDQVMIVVSLAAPALKPHLIDRYLALAEQGGLAPIIVLNKADLVDPVAVQPLVGAYSQLGIPTILTSTVTGLGIDRLRSMLRGRATVVSGQSGVGKSSLLNAIEAGLDRRVREVSDVNQKGMHTTTTAELIALSFGGWVVDTPGVRQLALWDTRPEEVEGYFREFRPFVSLCGFPDCSHTHENRCAVKNAVDRGFIAARRYTSYLGLFRGDDL